MKKVPHAVVEFKVEHPSSSGKPQRDYFAGATLDDVLKDTRGGTFFGQDTYLSHRVINSKEAETLGFKMYDGTGIYSKREF